MARVLPHVAGLVVVAEVHLEVRGSAVDADILVVPAVVDVEPELDVFAGLKFALGALAALDVIGLAVHNDCDLVARVRVVFKPVRCEGSPVARFAMQAGDAGG